MNIKIKICGLTNVKDLEACSLAKVNYVGFVFFKKSKRNLILSEANKIASNVPQNIVKVALTVDPKDLELDNLFSNFPVDTLQLHGHESPARVKEIKERYGVPIIKSISLRTKSDLEKIHEYTWVADQLLIDAAKPDKQSPPGGNGVIFDWSLISGYNWKIPWLLAGGLNHTNVCDAIRVSGAMQVDVSSGVERQPGIKDQNLIKEFARVARSGNHDG